MASVQPVVTGLSPIEGVPGTKLTIRGENLGTRPEDLVGLIICGVDCLMSAEWKTSNKIVARSSAGPNGAGIGKGDVIVVTAMGGRGTSTVQFRGFQETMGPLKDSAVWVDENTFLNMTFGRKRPMSPTATLHDDPLGLSVEGNERKELDSELLSTLPAGSADISTSEFSPEWFLIEHHPTTSYHDLRAGLEHLRRKVNTQKEGQISFLKANVGSVVEQINTLYDLKCQFESDIQEYGRQSTDVLEVAIFNCKEEADKLFEDVLQRKDRADSTRNALNVLYRFKFLLYLPVNIERHIQRGEYEVVINDYARAKSLFGDTQVPLFRRFYDEVEKRIEDLRGILSEQLTRVPANLEHQKKIIKNLYYLETPGDPAWECLSAQQSYILQLIAEARDSHLNREHADNDLGTTKNVTGVSGTAQHSTPAAKYNKIMSSSIGDWQETAPVRVLFVQRLCEVLSNNFPDMWKIGQAYFGRELLPNSAAVNHSKQIECKEMILELLTVFGGVVRGAIVPAQLDVDNVNYRKYHVWPDIALDLIAPWLPQVIRDVRDCYTSLLNLDLPNDALDIIRSLLVDLRIHCLASIFEQTKESVGNLHSIEKWKVELDDDEGGCTQLPHICENVIIECAQLVKETALESGHREPSLFDHPTFNENITTLLEEVIIAFAQSLEQLVIEDPDKDLPKSRPGIYSSTSPDVICTKPGVEAQLLITLSNCAYMKRVILPRLKESLVKAGYPEGQVTSAIDKANVTYSELQDTLFRAYYDERVDPITAMIERSMYLGNYDWDMHLPPSQVRTYVREILINIAHVHAEVVGVWPGLVSKLIGHAVEAVGNEMSYLFKGIKSWSSHGALQAHIDLAALNHTLKNYMNDNSIAHFQEASAQIPKISPEDRRVKETILRKFQQSMRLLQACFLDMDPDDVVLTII